MCHSLPNLHHYQQPSQLFNRLPHLDGVRQGHHRPLVHELKAAPHSKSFLGQRCKHGGIRDYVTSAEESAEVEEASNEEEESATTPEISLHALSGIATPQTMRVTGLIKGRRLHILIDSGSVGKILYIIVKKF